MKKLVLLVLVIAVLISGGAFFVSKKAPGVLREAIGRAINKTVQVSAIRYQFPWTFELEGFKVLETHEPFVNEECFSADAILLSVSPLSLSQKKLILDNVEVSQAKVRVRQRLGKIHHALSDAMREPTPDTEVTSDGVSTLSAQKPMPLVIRRFLLRDSSFQFVDFDVQQNGFVIELGEIQANIKDLSFPPQSKKTLYRVDAALQQGRQGIKAPFKLNGWSDFTNKETDAMLTASDLSLAYFEPYLSKVTPARIREGRLATRAALRLLEDTFTANVDLELGELYFDAYEDGDTLFGLKADEILSFFKDDAGKLKFQIVLQWQLGDAGEDKRKVVRRAIETSLKKTILGNVGNILEKTLQKLSEDGLDSSKDDLEESLKKVKKLFR